MGRIAAVVAVAALFATACLDIGNSRCGELVCPPGTACSAAHNECYDVDRFPGCAGEDDGAPCGIDSG